MIKKPLIHALPMIHSLGGTYIYQSWSAAPKHVLVKGHALGKELSGYSMTGCLQQHRNSVNLSLSISNKLRVTVQNPKQLQNEMILISMKAKLLLHHHTAALGPKSVLACSPNFTHAT